MLLTFIGPSVISSWSGVSALDEWAQWVQSACGIEGYMHRPAHTHQLQVRWWELILPCSDPLESKTYNTPHPPTPKTPSIIALVLVLNARTMMQKRGYTLLMQIANTPEQKENSNHWVHVLMSVLHGFFFAFLKFTLVPTNDVLFLFLEVASDLYCHDWLRVAFCVL